MTTQDRQTVKRWGGRGLCILRLGCAVVLLASSFAGAYTPTCAQAAVINFALAMRHSLSDEQIRVVTERCSPGASLLDVRRALRDLGYDTEGVRVSLEELATIRGAKVLALQEPAHLVVALQVGKELVQVLDERAFRVLPIAELTKRFLGLALVLAGQEAPGPKIRLERPDCFFAITGAGQTVQHTCLVANVGDQDLLITIQDAGCMCTASIVGERRVAPGETVKVDVETAVATAAPMQRRVLVTSNDPLEPLCFVTLTGLCPSGMVVTPERLHFFGEVRSTIRRSAVLNMPAGTTITKAEVDLPFLQCRCEQRPPVQDAGIWEIVVECTTAAPVGTWEGLLKVYTTHRERPVVTVPLSGRIRGSLMVSPALVVFGLISTGRPVSKDIIVTSSRGEPFHLLTLGCSDRRVRLGEPVELPDNQGWGFTVRVDTSEPGLVDTSVVIKTDVPAEEAIELPIHANIT